MVSIVVAANKIVLNVQLRDVNQYEENKKQIIGGFPYIT